MSRSIIYTNALVFDGRNTAPVQTDITVRDGVIAAIGTRHSPDGESQTIDCQGKWLMPGLLDIHTHMDLEVEVAPELPEIVRHGTTTVVMSNCSLGVAYGNQRRNGEDPIVDCFARVENIPKDVLTKVADACTWRTSAEYLQHFDTMNLGPNVVPLIPHSMLRIEVMGLNNSVSRNPTPAELDRMESLLEMGMQEGYVGFSTDGLPFHFLANRPNTQKQIPTQFAPYHELKRLTAVLRRHGRVWQATPPKDSPYNTVKNFLLTSGLFFGKPLKVTATAAIDLHTNRGVAKLGMLLTRLLNSPLINGMFRFQALSASFRVWSDGVITPLAEEVPELRRLNELELDDRTGRLRVLNDPEWIQAFRTMWYKGKSGFNLANLKRVLNREDNVLNRRFDDMIVDTCPVAAWHGETLDTVYRRLLAWQSAQGKPVEDSDETRFFASCPKPMTDDADFFLHLLRSWDTGFRWMTTVANRDSATLKKLLFHPLTLPGFNDSGAHLSNLAFYDGNLRTLKIAQPDGLAQVAFAIHRLTQAPAEFFGLNTGVLEVGAQADICVVDPEALQRWNPETTYAHIYRDLFECKQLVNRPLDVVSHVMIGGKIAWQDGQFDAQFGQTRFGRLLRANDHPSETAANVAPIARVA